MEQKQKYQVTTNPMETKGARASPYLTTIVNGEPASEFIADFEMEERAHDTCKILNTLLKSTTGWAGAKSQPSVTHPGSWKYEVHYVQHQEDADEYATISDGKVTLYIDGGQADGDKQRVVNLLNQLKIKLDYDHVAELLCSQLQALNKEYGEEITRLRGQVGLRWVKILSDADLPRDDSKEYVVKYEGGYDFKTVDGIKRLASQYVTFYLDESTSPASKKEGTIAFENWICNEEYYYRDKEGLWYMHGMSAGGKTTADLHALYQQSLTNK